MTFHFVLGHPQIIASVMTQARVRAEARVSDKPVIEVIDPRSASQKLPMNWKSRHPMPGSLSSSPISGNGWAEGVTR